MTDSRTPDTGPARTDVSAARTALRDRLAGTLRCPVCGVGPGVLCLRAGLHNEMPHMARAQAADAVLPVVEAWAAEQATATPDVLRDRLLAALDADPHLTSRDVADTVHRVYGAALAEQTQRAEQANTWTVAVEVPLSLPAEMRHRLFTVIANAVSDWEPDDRDGWDADVSGYPTADSLRAWQAEAAVQRVRAFAEDMRTWCSPHGVAADYAKRLLEVLDQPKETS